VANARSIRAGTICVDNTVRSRCRLFRGSPSFVAHIDADESSPRFLRRRSLRRTASIEAELFFFQNQSAVCDPTPIREAFDGSLFIDRGIKCFFNAKTSPRIFTESQLVFLRRRQKTFLNTYCWKVTASTSRSRAPPKTSR